ncbi:hypothetical protein SprV_0200566500 [Sparganum proliferum]
MEVCLTLVCCFTLAPFGHSQLDVFILLRNEADLKLQNAVAVTATGLPPADLHDTGLVLSGSPLILLGHGLVSDNVPEQEQLTCSIADHCCSIAHGVHKSPHSHHCCTKAQSSSAVHHCHLHKFPGDDDGHYISDSCHQ